MGLFTRLATGNRLPAATDVEFRDPAAATQNIRVQSPGMPQMPIWDGRQAIDQGYFGHVYVMRCARIIAETLGALPFRAGADPEKPADFNPDSPLARMLGPAPGGPNPTTSAYKLWIHSIVQRLLTGKMAWELDRNPGSRAVVGLWPLISAYLIPKPSGRKGVWFDGFDYRLPSGVRPLAADSVFYSWRPSPLDWREPESVLQAAKMPASVAIAADQYQFALLKNGMVATTLITTAPFADPASRRKFEDQFIAEFGGWNNAGKTVFSYTDAGQIGPDGKPVVGAGTSVQRIGMTTADAQLASIVAEAKRDICKAFGVPESMVGDASQRTYENADQEHRNYWTTTILPLAREIADDINLMLAPQLGPDVGWFDFSDVEALRPARVFAQIAPDNAVTAGLATAEDWRNDVGLPPMEGDTAPTPDVEELPAVDDTPGASGSGSSTSGGTGRSVLDEFGDRLAELDEDGLREIADVIELRHDVA